MNNYEQYLVCNERGHVSNGKSWINDGKVVWYTCKYCGTKFGTQITEIEKNVPKPGGKNE